jgi:hypothetical protein
MGEDRLLQEVLTEPGAGGCLLSKGIRYLGGRDGGGQAAPGGVD